MRRNHLNGMAQNYQYRDNNMESTTLEPRHQVSDLEDSGASKNAILMKEWIRLALGSLVSLGQEAGVAAGTEAVSEARAASVAAECSWQPTPHGTPARSEVARMPQDSFQPMALRADQAHQPKDSALQYSWRPLSSKTYLHAALKISHLLATQICALEELHMLPENQFNWSENIQIMTGPEGKPPSSAATNAGVKNPNENGKIKSNVSVCSSEVSSSNDTDLSDGRSFEHIKMGHLLGQTHSLRPSMNGTDIGKNHLSQNFNIICAELKCKLSDPNTCRNGENASSTREHDRIFALGIVFYELFSGGKCPPELEKLQTDSRLFNANLDPADDPRYNPLTPEQSRTVDLSSALNILEDDGAVHPLSHNSKSGVSEKEFSSNTTYDDFFKARIDQNIDPPNSDETGSFVSSSRLSDDVSAFESEPTNLPNASELVDVLDSGKETESSYDAPMITEAGFATNHMLNDIDGILVPCGESEAQNLPSAEELLEGLDFDDDDIRRSNDVTASNKRAHVDSTFTQSAISVEPLKLMSVPGDICNLIANMIDSINGDLSGEDAYRTMEDLKNDIKWMMDHLDEILSDIDPTEALKSKLMTSNKFYGRESELSQLVHAYKNDSSQVSVAIISGSSGSGKTRLAQQIGLLSSMDESIFLQGKYDQLQQSKPYSAISAAFDEYCYFLMAHPNLEYRITIASQLMEKIGQVGIIVLAKIVPALKNLFDPSMFVHVPPNDCVNAQQRLQYLLSMFVEIISEMSGSCFGMFLDDYQWADKASIELALQIMLRWKFSRKKSRLFFLMSYRDAAIHKEEWISSVESAGIEVTSIEMKGMDVGSVNTLISDLLCLLPRLTRQFSHIIHHKTQGNPLYVIELMKALCMEKILFFDLSRRRWMWKLDALNTRAISDDVAMLLTETINHLPLRVREALCVASCFGACLESSIIRALETELGLDLSVQLDVAVAEGIMDKRDENYYFAHDQVQDSAYKLVKPEERCFHHFRYGLSLSSVALREMNDSMLFTAVDQANRGGPNAVSDKSEALIVAQLNLQAGKMAVERSDFSLAFSFFDHGISYLSRGHWKDHYSLSLELFVEAIDCALAIGDSTRFTIMYDIVVKNAMNFEDTLRVNYSSLRALEAMYKHSKAIEKGLEMLGQLGVNLLFPHSPMSWKTDGLLEETETMLLSYTDSDILNYKRMNDIQKLMAMKVLERMAYLLYVETPESQPEATLNMLQLSLKYGLCPSSPTAFVSYGSHLVVLGRIREGYRYVNIALRLLDRLDSKEAASAVYAVAYPVKSFVEPFQSLQDFIWKGHKVGLETGDATFSLGSLVLHNEFVFYSGQNLQAVKSSVDEIPYHMGQYNVNYIMVQLLPIFRSVSVLIGENDQLATLMGKSIVDAESEEKKAMYMQNPRLLRNMHFYKMYDAFMMRSFNEMKENAKKVDSILPTVFTAFFTRVAIIFYKGLVSFWIARISKEKEWFDEGANAIALMKAWTDCCYWNFYNKLCLLEAERCRNLNDLVSAKQFYEESISAAKRHKFLNEVALSCELAGYFCFDIGNRDEALAYLVQSSQAYLSWGALAKVEYVNDFIQNNLVKTDSV